MLNSQNIIAEVLEKNKLLINREEGYDAKQRLEAELIWNSIGKGRIVRYVFLHLYVPFQKEQGKILDILEKNLSILNNKLNKHGMNIEFYDYKYVVLTLTENEAREKYLRDGKWAEGVFTDPFIHIDRGNWYLHPAKIPFAIRFEPPSNPMCFDIEQALRSRSTRNTFFSPCVAKLTARFIAVIVSPSPARADVTAIEVQLCCLSRRRTRVRSILYADIAC